MNGIKVILIIGLALVACGEQAEQLLPLSKNAPNTVTLSNGEIVYNMDGEWNAIIDDSPWGEFKDILTITQEGNKFVGIISKGNEKYHKGDELIKGELVKNGFESIERNTVQGWMTETIGKIDEGCNKIVVETDVGTSTHTIELNRI